MTESRKCPDCGTALPPNAPPGQCPACLFRIGLAAAAGGLGTATQLPPDARHTLKVEPADAPGEAVGQTLGRYKLLEKLGEGGGGVVYVAEQTHPVRRRVALKVIKLGMDTKAVIARFEVERQALAMMDHPNIAKVFDAGTTETGRPYFVMELVRGIRITDYCDQNHLPTRQRLDLFIKVCQAIQHAHQKGIIHRDIKPSNLLVTLHDGVPVPKVIDFGIAKATEGRLTDATVYTQLHQFIGTPAYISPEQAEMSGLDIDTRSDIYSLGVLLYELLTGKTPFDAQALMASGIDAMRRTIRENEPVRPSTKLATLQGEELTTTAKRRASDAPKLIHLLQGDLDWIVMKCLEKDRTRRYETANGLAADITRHLNNEPVIARPPSTAYRFQKAFRRNRVVFAATAAIAVALVAGIAASTWQAIRATRAEREQVRQRLEAEQARERETRMRQQAEVREKIALAGALVDQGDLNRAEDLMVGIGPTTLEPTVANAESIRFLGKWNVLNNRPREAAEALALSLHANPEGGDVLNTSKLYVQLACLWIELGDTDAYERLRRDTLARFARSHDFLIRYRTAQLGLLLPPNAESLEQIRILIQTVASADLEDAGMASWQKFLLALFEYRQRNYATAVQHCEQVTKLSSQDRLAACSLALLAVSEYHVRHTAEAGAAYDKCQDLLNSAPNPINRPHEYWHDWHDWWFARFLLREAEELANSNSVEESEKQ